MRDIIITVLIASSIINITIALRYINSTIYRNMGFRLFKKELLISLIPVPIIYAIISIVMIHSKIEFEEICVYDKTEFRPQFLKRISDK